jgi:DNA-binding XRE family transcriptional regulator
LNKKGGAKMNQDERWLCINDDKERYCSVLCKFLPELRAKIKITQEDFARLLGISRQTYSNIERDYKKISWPLFLSMVFFFDKKYETHNLIRDCGAYPITYINQFNDGIPVDVENFDMEDNPHHIQIKKMIQSLDELGLHTVQVVLQMEYERCTNPQKETLINWKKVGRNNDGKIS